MKLSIGHHRFTHTARALALCTHRTESAAAAAKQLHYSVIHPSIHPAIQSIFSAPIGRRTRTYIRGRGWGGGGEYHATTIHPSIQHQRMTREVLGVLVDQRIDTATHKKSLHNGSSIDIHQKTCATFLHTHPIRSSPPPPSIILFAICSWMYTGHFQSQKSTTHSRRPFCGPGGRTSIKRIRGSQSAKNKNCTMSSKTKSAQWNLSLK